MSWTRTIKPLVVAARLGVAVVAVGVPLAAHAPTAVAAQVQVDNATLATLLQALNQFAAQSFESLQQGDPAAAQALYRQFDTGWDAIEDGVRDRSRDAYRNIEDAMRDADRALNANPPDATAASTALTALQTRMNDFIATLTGGMVE